MKYAILATVLFLSACGKAEDMFKTSFDGYSVRCIEGTKYVMMTSEHGLAVSPLVGTDGKPKGCEVTSK